MKRNLLAIIVVAIMALVISGCGSKESVYGYYLLTGMEVDGEYTEVDSTENIGISILKDGTFTTSSGSDMEVDSGTWKLEDDKLYLSPKESEPRTLLFDDSKGDTLIYEDDNITLIYKQPSSAE